MPVPRTGSAFPQAASQRRPLRRSFQKSYSQPLLRSITARWPSLAGSGAAPAGIGTLRSARRGRHEAVMRTRRRGVCAPAM